MASTLMSSSTKSAMTWNDLTGFLGRYSTILVTSHQNPDGDCIGSQLAFRWYLSSIGKKVVVYNRDPVPPRRQPSGRRSPGRR